MSKRNNVLENFETCYLKANLARKAFANKAALDKLVAEADFERCVRYIANITFNRNSHALLRHGFDRDDVANIARVLGMQFVNYQFEGKAKKDTYYILMRFISQKLDSFMIFVDRKFRISERHSDVGMDAYTEDVLSMELYEGDKFLPEDLPPVEEEYESKYARKLASIKVEIEEMRSAALRFCLNSNMDQYSDRLAEIATSKLVEFSVRKKARSLCKKNGIDYVAWAKVQIKNRNLNEADFILK